MDDIIKPNRRNIGGVLRYNFIDVNDVQSIDIAINSVISNAVTLKAGKQWSVGYGTLGSMSYTEPPELTSSGTIYKRLFTAACPEDNAGNTNLFELMSNKQFIIDYTDNNGLRKLVGSLDEPLFFSPTLNTKSGIPELGGNFISFYGDGSHKAYIYDI